MSEAEIKLEPRQYLRELLEESETSIQRATSLFRSGEPEAVFSTDIRKRSTSPRSSFVKFWRGLFGESGVPKGRNITFDHVTPNRNQLIVYRDWIVRCTYQQFEYDLDRELLYVTGAPLSFVTRLWLNGHGLVVLAFNSEYAKSEREKRIEESGSGGYCGSEVLGELIPIKPNDEPRLIALFENLKAQGRLHPTARLD